MLKVGITGGIGSGKTTVCKIFEALDISVYYADIRAKVVMIEDKTVITAVKQLLGDNAYSDDGQLNRAHVANIIFNDKEKLRGINAIVHPAVGRDYQNWFSKLPNKPYSLREAAITFETGGDKHLDKIITVYTPKETRISRVLERDNTTREAVEARIDKQMPDEEKVKRADFVIYNDGSKSLIKQVLSIHKSLVAMNAKQENMKNKIAHLRITRQNILRDFGNLSTEQLNKIPKGFNNNMIWNLGHLLVTQQRLNYLLADLPFRVGADLMDDYKKGSKPVKNASDEEIQYIKQHFLKAVDWLEKDYEAGVFQNFKEYSTSYGATLTNIEQAISFNNIHEAMHYGYMKALIKVL